MKIRKRLSYTARRIIREVVRNERSDGLSRAMRQIADGNARDTLRDEYGIRVSLKRLERIA